MKEPPTAPCPPISSESVEWTEFSHGDRFGIRYRHLTLAVTGEGYRVGVAIEELPPGKQTAPFHYHMLEEEHVLILDGECTLRLGDERYRMRAGDYACFPAGQKTGHCLINETDAVCRYVIIGENNPNEVSVYPDSNKVQVRWLNERYDRGAKRDYWDGED
jgi:uncharacterized cupin superfamily protein